LITNTDSDIHYRRKADVAVFKHPAKVAFWVSKARAAQEMESITAKGEMFCQAAPQNQGSIIG